MSEDYPVTVEVLSVQLKTIDEDLRELKRTLMEAEKRLRRVELIGLVLGGSGLLGGGVSLSSILGLFGGG